MPTGHFSIGDLTFSFEGDLKELAHCQEIIREIERAEQRLRRASGSQEVFLIYDQDLEGERGTFDKMRLRAYDDATNYTLDIGVTDTNPLGIYVGYDQNIEVYDREKGETWQIDPTGNRIEESGEQEGTVEPAPSPSPEPSPPADTQPVAQESEVPPSSSRAEVERAATMLRTRVRGLPSKQLVGETTIPDGPLGERLKGFAKYCGRDEGYVYRVLDAVGVSAIEELTVGQVDDVIGMIADEEMLRQNESFEPDDELPF